MSDKIVNDKEAPSFGKELYDLVKVVVEALLIALIIRTFIFGLVVIPSGSMIPTLLVGDYLYVTKYAYGFSKHSFPYSVGPFSGRILGVEPKLGDVVVFKASDKKTDFIKRLVGLPGDTIQVKNGVLYINDAAVSKQRIADFNDIDSYGNVKVVEQYVETLPTGVKHNTLDYGDVIVNEGSVNPDNTRVYEVPSGHYFMMGDNRDGSNDARFQTSVKMVSFEDIIGRADFLLLSFKGGGSFYKFWEWPNTMRTERMFQSLDNYVDK